MKEKRLNILKELKGGYITSEQADKKLLFLFRNSISDNHQSGKDSFTNIATKIESNWQMVGLSGTIYEDYARECFIEWFKEQEYKY